MSNTCEQCLCRTCPIPTPKSLWIRGECSGCKATIPCDNPVTECFDLLSFEKRLDAAMSDR